MALAKVQITITYEYPAEYDADGVVTLEHERISNEAQGVVRGLIGENVSINKGKETVVSDVKITSGGVSVVTVPQDK